MVWCIFDCDRKETDNAIYAGIGDEDWEEADGRCDDENSIDPGRVVLTFAAKLGEEKPYHFSPFSFRMGQYLTQFLNEG